MLKCGRSVRSWACGFVLCLSWLSPVCATAQPAAETSSGPYDVRVLAGGVGLGIEIQRRLRVWAHPLLPWGGALAPGAVLQAFTPLKGCPHTGVR